jgi:hypothetical protein
VTRQTCALWTTFLLLLVAVPSAVGQEADMGRAYEQLESQALKVLTDFGSVQSISVRDSSDNIQSVLVDDSGREIRRMSIDSHSRVVTPPAGPHHSVNPPPEVTLSLDWANLQLFSLWRDEAGFGPSLSPRPLVFDGLLFRPLDKAGRASEEHLGAMRSAIRAVETEFPTLIAQSESHAVPPPEEQEPGHVYSAFTSRLFERGTGKRIGILQWFADMQTLAWKLPGRTEGFVDPSRLDLAHYGGWPFEPDQAWANIQLFAFHQLHGLELGGSSRITAALSFQSGDGATLKIDFGSSGSNRATAANSVGCDGLHWLDNTIFRPCCDDHDDCYGYDENGDPTVPNPCGWQSWLFLQGWDCSECNAEVLWCFLTGGGSAGDPWGGPTVNNKDVCDTGIGDYCSAECSQCY